MLAGASESTIAEIIRQAEAYLEAQLIAGIAADQRASAFAAMLAGALAVMTAGAGALIFAESSNPALALPLLPAIVCFALAVRRAIHASRPAAFDYKGNTPRGWLRDVREDVPLKVSLAEQAAHYAAGIEANGKTLDENCRLMSGAIQWAWRGFVGSIVLAAVFAAAKITGFAD